MCKTGKQYDSDAASGARRIKTNRSDEERRQKVYYYMMTERLNHVIWRVNLETMTVLDVSSSVKRLRGYEPAEVIGRRMDEVLTPASYSKMAATLSEWLVSLPDASGNKFRFVGAVEQPRRDGTTVWVEMAIHLFHRTDGGAEAVGISRELWQQEALWAVCRQMAERERFLQVIWDAAPCYLSCVDHNGNFLQVNQRYADFWKIDRRKIRGHHFSKVIPPALYDKHAKIFAESLQGKTVEFLDQCKTQRSEKDRWAYGVYTPVFLANGKVKKVIVAVMDVTEQYEMKRQLIEAEKLGRTGSWRINLTTKEFTCSEGVLELYCISQEDVEKRSYEALCSRSAPEDVQKIMEKFRTIVTGNHSVTEELALNLPGGIRRLVKITGFLLKDAAGRPAEILGRIEDITQQRALDKAERDAVLRLREFSRTMPGAGMIVDALGTVVEVFDDNQLLSKNAAAAWPGRSIPDLLPADAGRRMLQDIGCAIAKDMLQFDEYTLETDRGNRIFDVRIAPLSYRQAERATAACYLTDVTDQNRTKKLLELTYEKRRQRDLLNALAEGKLTPSQEVLDQAWQVKLNLTQDFSCYLIVLKKGAADETGLRQERREKLQKMTDRLLEGFSGEPGVIAWESKDGLALLAPVGPEGQVGRDYEVEQAGRWQKLVRQYAPEAECCIGIAEFHAGMFWSFAKVYAQSRTAVKLGCKLAPDQSIHHYLDIGVFQFFPAVLERSYVAEFVQRNLGKLIEYDRTQGTELMDTLEKLLQIDNLNRVAKKLYVHRQTVSFRKRRIEAVLGVSLNNFETRLALGMALKFMKVFGGNM